MQTIKIDMKRLTDSRNLDLRNSRLCCLVESKRLKLIDVYKIDNYRYMPKTDNIKEIMLADDEFKNSTEGVLFTKLCTMKNALAENDIGEAVMSLSDSKEREFLSGLFEDEYGTSLDFSGSLVRTPLP